MAISASWFNDSTDPAIRQGYVVRNGIDSASTGYRYDNLGLVYLDKNNDKLLDADDLVIGSIVDLQPGNNGSLTQDNSQPTLYKINSSESTSKASGITVIFDADFNSGKPVAPPAPKVVVKPGGSSSAPADNSTTSTATGPGSIFNNTGGTNSASTTTTATTPASAGTGTTPSTSATTLPSTLPGVLGTSASNTNPSSAGSGTTASAGSTTKPPSTLTTKGNTISVTSAATSKAQSNQSQEANATISLSGKSFIEELVQAWFPTPNTVATQQTNPSGIILDLSSLGNQKQASLVQVSKAKSANGATIQSNTTTATEASALLGDKGNDIITGAIGIDLIDGGAGNDLIKAGDGDDIITGGLGADRIYGGFGKNTFLNEKDGASDTLYISSDQFLVNPNLANKSGNNIDGSKADIITSIDINDKIIVLGVATSDLSFHYGLGPAGTNGIGIYAKGFLEAIYIGGDLNIQQLTNLTSGRVSGYVDIANSL